MAQSKEFVDASHALNDLSHAIALFEAENASLRGAVDGLCNENVKLRELCADLYAEMITYSKAPDYNASVWAPKLRELGVEVTS